MQNQLKCLKVLLLLMTVSCSQEQKDYLDFPVKEIELPKVSKTLSPGQTLLRDSPEYEDFVVDENHVVGILSPARVNQEFLAAEDLSNGDYLGAFFRRGRGPEEMLNPVFSLDYYKGHLYLFDIVLSRFYDLDIKQSLTESRSVFMNRWDIKKEGQIRAFLSAHYIDKERMIAYDFAANPRANELYRIPYYVIYDLKTGEKIEEIECFKDVPLEEKKHVDPKSRLGLVDCLDADRRFLYFGMMSMPVVGRIDLNTRDVKGVWINKEKDSDKSITFQSVSARGGKVYALYNNGEQAVDGEVQSSLAVLSKDLLRMKVYSLDDIYRRCFAGEDGLYLLRADYAGESSICLIPWEEL